MKKRFTTIFTVTVAAVLVGSIAYAAKKKLKTKSALITTDVSEVDLAATLLDAKGERVHKPPKDSDAKSREDDQLKDLVVAENTKEIMTVK